MSLREILHQYCEDNDLKQFTCIVHIALLNYTANFSKKHDDWLNFSPLVLNSYIGIGEEKINKLLLFLSEKLPEYIEVEYRYNCKDVNFNDMFGITILKNDFIENQSSDEPCLRCSEFHSYSLMTDKYELGFSGNSLKILEDLKLSDEDIIKELVVINTNEEHLDKIANILVSKLKLEKSKEPEAKKGIIKYMHTFREFTKVLSDISGDAATITENVIKIGKDATGITDLKDVLTSSRK